MKIVVLQILCEGQTEERFVKEILSPYLSQYGIFPKPILLVTSRKKNARGGMISYQQAKGDLERLQKQFKDNESERHIFTTMFDYYALPNDFPFFEESLKISDVNQRINILEEKFSNDISSERFIPYLQMHEFEALLFANIACLRSEYPLARKEIDRLKLETDSIEPELINSLPETAPSKRIIRALTGKYRYNKVRSGVKVTSLIGIESILSKCYHFRYWINQIIEFSNLH